jgi:predicted secreted protein
MTAGGDGRSVARLRVGDQHVLELPGLGTAGYRWQWTVAGDPSLLSVRRLPAAEPAPRRPGASAAERFAIEARRPGRVRVEFVQRRPFEPEEVPPNRRHQLEVEIVP